MIPPEASSPPPLSPPFSPPPPSPQLEQACIPGQVLASELFVMALRPDGKWHRAR